MTSIYLKVEGMFKKTILYTSVGSVFTNNISKIKLGVKVLQVDILCSNNVPNKMKRHDVVTFVKSFIRVDGAVDN